MARRTQGTPAGLTRDRVVAAAVDLVDREGLESFGVRRLAGELGVDPMSIYHHVKGKATLLDAISESVLTEAVAMRPGERRWPDDWMGLARTLAHEYRALAKRHPRVFPLLTTRAQTSARALGAIEHLTAAMRRGGLPDQEVADAPLVLFGFLNGYLLAALSADPAGTPRSFDAAAFPTLVSLAPLQTGFGGDAEFERMLETVLNGIAQRGTTTAQPSQEQAAGMEYLPHPQS